MADLLSELVQTIETLQKRISERGVELRKNEFRTRIVLIDPLLKALGWDVADSEMVTVEFETGNGRADYALLTDGAASPRMVIEAKKLNEPLAPHRMQLVNYANVEGIAYGCLTDGNFWEVYDIFPNFAGVPQPLDQRKLLDVTIAGGGRTSVQLAFDMLRLWRNNLQSGGGSTPVSLPLIGSGGQTGSPLERAVVAHSAGNVPVSSQPIIAGWTALSGDYGTTGKSAPRAIRFSDGEEKQTRHWCQLLRETAVWLYGQGLLTRDNCQISTGQTQNTKRYLFSVDGKHSDGTPFGDCCC